MSEIRVAIVGVGNCASSLVQGISYYADPGADPVGLLHPVLGGFAPGDVKIVAGVDIDVRKVGKTVGEAIFQPPNNTQVFCPEVDCDAPVVMGAVLDGVSEHMNDFAEHRRFVPAKLPDANRQQIVSLLKETGAEILMNFLPVGSQKATEFYAECCLEAGVSLINCMPVFIVSDGKWAQRFKAAGIPCVGDDVKAQVGATVVHRVLSRLMTQRGAQIDATYQLNTGGNTDFLNMLNYSRLSSKKVSKTEAVQSQLKERLPDDQVHIGPSDYVPWQNDNKVCFLRIEARGFGGVPLHLEARLSVEDSPNSAGETIDAIRCCKLARDAGLAGPLEAISAFTMKHPPVQYPDFQAADMLERFITETVKLAREGGNGEGYEIPVGIDIKASKPLA